MQAIRIPVFERHDRRSRNRAVVTSTDYGDSPAPGQAIIARWSINPADRAVDEVVATGRAEDSSRFQTPQTLLAEPQITGGFCEGTQHTSYWWTAQSVSVIHVDDVADRLDICLHVDKNS